MALRSHDAFALFARAPTSRSSITDVRQVAVAKRVITVHGRMKPHVLGNVASNAAFDHVVVAGLAVNSVELVGQCRPVGNCCGATLDSDVFKPRNSLETLFSPDHRRMVRQARRRYPCVVLT